MSVESRYKQHKVLKMHAPLYKPVYLYICHGLVRGHYVRPMGIIRVLETGEKEAPIQSVISYKHKRATACMKAVFGKYNGFPKVYYRILARIALYAMVSREPPNIGKVLSPYRLWS